MELHILNMPSKIIPLLSDAGDQEVSVFLPELKFAIPPRDVEHPPLGEGIPHDCIRIPDASRLVNLKPSVLENACSRKCLRFYRAVGGAKSSIWIHPVDLILFMIHHAPKANRWKCSSVPLSELDLSNRFQLRACPQRDKIKKIAAHLRNGGLLDDPIWVVQFEGGKLVPIDGHTRRDGALEAKRDRIDAVQIKLPLWAIGPIALEINYRHGENLKAGDTESEVQRALDEHPDWATELHSGAISQQEFARRINVSQGSVSRALKALLKKHKQPLNKSDILQKLRPLIDHAQHHTQQNEISEGRIQGSR
jgi:hypothetical protein